LLQSTEKYYLGVAGNNNSDNQAQKRNRMAEKRESGRDLLPVLFAVAVMMVVVYFLQATEKNRAIKSGRQQIEALKQTITDLTTELTRAQNQLEDLEASHASLKQDLRSAREIIGELESKRQKHTREIDMLGIVIQQKDQKIAELESRIKTLQNTSGTKEGQKERPQPGNRNQW
jgi:predicted  nucleic acid-binding Zn-ribbon protein